METEETLLKLIRLGLGHYDTLQIVDIDWPAIKALAEKQGLTAIILDGIGNLPEDKRPPKLLLLNWIGEVHQFYEQRHEQYLQAISELAKFYNSHGFKMMILKGYACSLDWPRPNHRPCGDIDIWQFGHLKDADKALRQAQGPKFEFDSSHHHHTVFYWRDFMVENHYDFINIHSIRSNRELEKIFKHLGEDDNHTVEVYGEKVYLPSPNLHALFLIRHAVAHFSSTELNLRQVLDWGFFMKEHTHEIDWDWFFDILDKFHLKDFYNCMNAICVEDLGFEVSVFPQVQFDLRIKERVLNDILSPEFKEEEPNGIVRRAVFKYCRWKANEWKHNLCFNESRLSAFLTGIWNHLLKPKSI